MVVEYKGRPGKTKSRTFRRVQRKTPGGVTRTYFKPKKTSKHVCALCKVLLHGTPRGRPAEINRLAKSKRSPERAFGGQLCSKCTRKVLAMKAQLKFKAITSDKVPISWKNYVIG